MNELNFSGFDWRIKTGVSRGPGPNNWAYDNVFLSDNELHLRINKRDKAWYCAELSSVDTVEYGDFSFNIVSDVTLLPSNVVFGFFLYQNDSREIDIEFLNGKAYYCVQPDQVFSENIGLTNNYHWHKISYRKDRIYFRSWHQISSVQVLYSEWTAKPRNIPNPSKTRLHINLWLKDGSPASSDAEVIIRSIKFVKF